MDSLKTLLDKKQYDLVLSLTKEAKDPEVLVYQLSALLGKGEAKEAEALFLKHREELWAYRPYLCLKTNFELRFINAHFEEAYDDVSYFEGKPYVSQEVEEYLRDLPKRIRVNEKNQDLAEHYNPEKIEAIFHASNDDYQLLNLLNSLSGSDLTPYLSDIKALLVSKHHSSIRTYALLLLIEAHYPEAVDFFKNGKTYHLVPKDLVPPYSGKLFQDFLAYLNALTPDPSLVNVERSLLNDYILDVYPETVITTSKDSILAAALLLLAKDYLRFGDPKENEAELPQADQAKILALKEKIAATIRAEEPLHI